MSQVILWKARSSRPSGLGSRHSCSPRTRRALLLGILFGWVGPVVAGPKPSAAKSVDVSLIQLIASPAQFEGKRVRLRGYCHFAFEEKAIYLHREDSEMLNPQNGLWLDTSEPRQDVSDTYVIVEGTFTAREQGHLGLWPGALVQITRLEKARGRSPR